MLPEVLELFEITTRGEKLIGGQDSSMKYGDIVLKPVSDSSYYEKCCQVLEQLEAKDYRISRPIKSVNGNYVELGYGATRYEKGYDCDEALSEKIAAGVLHLRDLEDIDPSVFDYADDPWGNANRILWNNEELPLNWSVETREFLGELITQLDNYEDPLQLVHGDLGGNILLDQELGPLIIDFSPTIAPAKYALSLIVTDSIAWASLPLESLFVIKDIVEYKPYLQRSILFRLLTIPSFGDRTYDDLMSAWKLFEPIWNFVHSIK